MTRRSFLANLTGALAVLALPLAVKRAAEERIDRAQRIGAVFDGMPPYDIEAFKERPWPPHLGVTRWTLVGEEWVPAESKWGDPNPAYLDAVYDELRLTALPRIFA